MLGIESLGRILLLVGAGIFFIGLLLTLGPKIPLIGRLPGDIFIEREGFSLYIPIATSILLSIVLTLLLNLIGLLWKR